jgi:hypothetical protein
MHIVGKVMSRRRSLEILTVTIEAFKAIRGTLSLGSVAFEAGPPSAAKEGPLSVDPVAVTRSHHQEYRSSNPLSSTARAVAVSRPKNHSTLWGLIALVCGRILLNFGLGRPYQQVARTNLGVI